MKTFPFRPLTNLVMTPANLTCDGVDLADLASRHRTPLYVYSSAHIEKQIKELRRAFKGLPVTICYALKANTNFTLLNFLAKHDVAADLVSGGELWRAKNAQMNLKQSVFSGVGKTADEIALALKSQIKFFNVESKSELELINRVASKLKVTAQISLRFNPDVDAKTHPYISTGLHENKFGLDKAEILTIASTFGALKSCSLRALSVHIGSQIQTVGPFRDSFIKLRELRNLLLAQGFKIDSLDLGGGFSIPYRQNEKSFDLDKYAKTVKALFSDVKELTIEPGRFLVGNSGILLSRVLHVKKTRKKKFLIVDAGMNDLVRPALYQSYHEIITIPCASGPNHLKGSTGFDVVGPVCESSDSFTKNRKFSKATTAGDLIAILSAGAYGMSMANQYNSRFKPAEIWLESNARGKAKARLIRHRDSYRDLVTNEVLKKESRK